MSGETSSQDLGLAEAIEALAEDRFRVREDAFVQNPTDLVPMVTTRRVAMWQPPLLDQDQQAAIGNIAGLIDKARAKFETTSGRSGRTLADQHRVARGREASYAAIAETLSEAIGVAQGRGLDLRITTSLVSLAEEGVLVRRVILKTIPAKAATRAA